MIYLPLVGALLLATFFACVKTMKVIELEKEVNGLKARSRWATSIMDNYTEERLELLKEIYELKQSEQTLIETIAELEEMNYVK